ncbi:MAG: hypothetical protein O4808_12430 [Trichodesmium sp. St17_bin3_1_1]|nr:hypothetical protein [Trichodesmium sp. St17_bin3_1_1]
MSVPVECEFTPSNFVMDDTLRETVSVNECEPKTIDLTISNDTYPAGVNVTALNGEEFLCNLSFQAPAFETNTYEDFFENEEKCEGKLLNKLEFEISVGDVDHITVENVESNLAE